jgi:DNA-binding transcriptional regulator GbsR (MarR family)
MGMLWGVNRSIARIHALLIVADGPLSLDEIAERLQMSRGNTSMSLRELRSWGVVKRLKPAGDRRDWYETEPDVWRMFFAIISERKRRELDPALDAVRAALRDAQAGAEAGDVPPAVVARLAQMADLMGTLERILARFLANEKASRSMLAFLTGWLSGEG